MSNPAKEKVIVALDVPDRAAAENRLQQLTGLVDRVKIGLQLFIAEGPAIVQSARAAGFSVFLDLKLHDIPHTVACAVESAVRLEVEFLTVHTLGGPAMLHAAAEAARGSSLRLLGVTLLTSMDVPQAQAIGLPIGSPGSTADSENPLADHVSRLAAMAAANGLPGAVASPWETARLRQERGPDFALVIPGIRPPGAPAGDQKRIMTPAQALHAGATHLVMGRPLLQAPDPAAVLQAINASL
jgi:orotidine-5'-phosphate decarboxylase